MQKNQLDKILATIEKNRRNEAVEKEVMMLEKSLKQFKQHEKRQLTELKVLQDTNKEVSLPSCPILVTTKFRTRYTFLIFSVHYSPNFIEQLLKRIQLLPEKADDPRTLKNKNRYLESLIQPLRAEHSSLLNVEQLQMTVSL